VVSEGIERQTKDCHHVLCSRLIRCFISSKLAAPEIMVLKGCMVSKRFTLIYSYDAGSQWHAILESFPAYLAECGNRIRQLW
jgi:hypothetical protein